MAVMCPICGAENPDSAEYCNLCLGSMGFFGSDAVDPVPEDSSVYQKKYPSSFSSDSSTLNDDTSVESRPEAPPADVGEYGVRSGYEFELTAASGSKRIHLGPPSRNGLRKKNSKS